MRQTGRGRDFCNLSQNVSEMNLYIFNETRRGAVYGVGTYIRELTAALNKSDISICVINLFSEKRQMQTEETDGIRHWYFPAPVLEQQAADFQKQRELYFRNVTYLLQLHILDKKELIFHLNYHQNKSLSEELKKAFDCRIVSVVHFADWGFTVFDNLPRLRRILKEGQLDSFGERVKKSFEEERSYYESVDHVISLSNYMQEILCLDYGLEVTKIAVIPNGLSDMAIETADLKFLRKKWNLSLREKILLFVGRVDEVKGINYLIRAFREVLKAKPYCRLMIVGSGNYDLFFQEAKDICTKITFTGLLEKKELYEIYQIADVGVVPSLFEPFGYVSVEMMMHRLPLVVTATSGMNEIVDESCGLKVPILKSPDNLEVNVCVLAQKIRFLLQNPVEAKQLGENGRKRYLEKYSLHIFRESMKMFYKSLFQ